MVFRVLMLLPLWQAPLPWVHAHSDLTDFRSGNVWLRSHLQAFHAPRSVEAPSGGHWHFHLLLPWMIGGEGETEVPLNPDADCFPVFDRDAESYAGTGLLQELKATTPRFFLGDPNAVSPLLVPAVSSLQPRWFLEAFASSLSLPERLCVSRC
ncbi:hypothetical protein [Planctomicrobium sp. SH664]|uniref:hypothetical protein n=1 Tax=Planctomicrobium sp. SH664 TaxID=3448125 RepID=UPI003F5AE3A4